METDTQTEQEIDGEFARLRLTIDQAGPSGIGWFELESGSLVSPRHRILILASLRLVGEIVEIGKLYLPYGNPSERYVATKFCPLAYGATAVLATISSYGRLTAEELVRQHEGQPSAAVLETAKSLCDCGLIRSVEVPIMGQTRTVFEAYRPLMQRS